MSLSEIFVYKKIPIMLNFIPFVASKLAIRETLEEIEEILKKFL